MTVSHDQERLWDIEKAFWLEGIDAYRRHMADDAVMVFPAPSGIIFGNGIYDALAQAPRWLGLEVADHRVASIADDVTLLIYRAKAVRADTQYEAFCSSCYRRISSDWKLVQHQQTPIDARPDD